MKLVIETVIETSKAELVSKYLSRIVVELANHGLFLLPFRRKVDKREWKNPRDTHACFHVSAFASF